MVIKEPWLLMFKMKPTIYPTEIEPFGGSCNPVGWWSLACDSLSGRPLPSYAYISRYYAPITETRAGIAANKFISKTAAHGWLVMGNQIGLMTTYVKEYFPSSGFVAKLHELGAVVGVNSKRKCRKTRSWWCGHPFLVENRRWVSVVLRSSKVQNGWIGWSSRCRSVRMLLKNVRSNVFFCNGNALLPS